MAKSSRNLASGPSSNISTGGFNGSHYEIHRDGPGAFLSVTLQSDRQLIIYTNLNNVIGKSGDVTIQGISDISLKDILLFPETTKSTIKGPGEVLLAPPICGDIYAIQLNGSTEWMIGTNGLVAMSDDVSHNIESKNISTALFHRADRFSNISGNGIFFVNSIGSMIERQLKRDERWTVRADHLVACNCRLVEHSKEFSKDIYIFEGPGTLITQSQSAQILSKWMKTLK